jgi:HAD superfamily hydrolase (TIGR01459 family)
MIEPTFCSGLADLASRYRGFIVDQWGVLHDGARPYADALDCLMRLREAGKRIVLLSNSGKRTAGNRARLAEIGIDAALYDALVTSGEATWQALAERTEPFFKALGRRCILWSRYGDRSIAEGLPLELVERVEDAEFLLLAGVEDDARLEDFGAQLEAAAGRGLPMVCAPIRTSSRCSRTAPSAWRRARSRTITSSWAAASATSASRTARSTRRASRRSAMCRGPRC